MSRRLYIGNLLFVPLNAGLAGANASDGRIAMAAIGLAAMCAGLFVLVKHGGPT